ncbi:MAG: D-alanyl-D-alanine carboxypeptidase [Chloroflexota bacterium]|nr:D-alanyl-D-alanine carboxypeptidase [Chloroflexota bacterium]
MVRRIIAICLLVVAVSIAIITPVLAFTPVGTSLLGQFAPAAPTPTPTLVPFTPTPPPSPTPILTPRGQPPAIDASEAILLDADTGRILVDIHGETPRPMASTTKIMTALIAIQAADLNQVITIHQDAIDEVLLNGGSSARLVVGDQIALKDLLYGLLLPSGDDAAVAIADAISGSPSNFTHTMNLLAYRLRLFQTHYMDPDGLSSTNHYSTAYDLARLAQYAMSVPLFAQIVKTQSYTLPASGDHHSYIWKTTNLLLAGYTGSTGIKTGTTGPAGYCLVFSATRAGHHLIGALLNAHSEEQRFHDARTLLTWGFALPLLPPTP